jgi:hypothetical protein
MLLLSAAGVLPVDSIYYPFFSAAGILLFFVTFMSSLLVDVHIPSAAYFLAVATFLKNRTEMC